MSDDLFRLVEFDEGGEVSGKGTKRLVCNIEGGGKLAIWGEERNRRNIDAVLAAGLPCVVRCASVEPKPWAKEHGHTHWVPQHVRLDVCGQMDMGGKP